MEVCVSLLLVFVATVHGGPKGGSDDCTVENQTRLLPGTTDSSDVHGFVQVCEDSQWKFICDGNWTVADATVACRQLGYGAAAPIETSGQIEHDVLSYTPQCSGTEQNLSSCLSTPHSGQCTTTPRAAVSCWNRSSSSSIATTTLTTIITSSQTLSSSSSPPSGPAPSRTSSPHLRPTPTPTKTEVPSLTSHHPAETSSTDTPVVSHTPSPDRQPGDNESTSEGTVLSSSVIYIVAASGVVVLLTAVLVLVAVIACKKCCVGRRKGLVVEDHTYDRPIPGQQNKTYLEMEHSKNAQRLPENEILYDQVKGPAEPDGTGQTYHTLKHSPDISGKRSNGSCSEVPQNEALYEKIVKPPSQQPPQVARKPAVYEEPRSNGKPFYHTLEASPTVGSPHKYHVLESSSHEYHVLESSQGKEEPVYSEASQRRAATFPRQSQTTQASRRGINEYVFEPQVEVML